MQIMFSSKKGTILNINCHCIVLILLVIIEFILFSSKGGGGGGSGRQVTRTRARIVRTPASNLRGRGSSGVIMGGNSSGSGSRTVISAPYVPEELVSQAQVVLQGKSRNLIIRELQVCTYYFFSRQQSNGVVQSFWKETNETVSLAL